MVMVGLSCFLEICRIDMVRVVIFNLWLKVMCIIEGGL